VADLEALVGDLMHQLQGVRQEIDDKASVVQLEAVQQAIQTEMNSKALKADVVDDKLQSLRIDQLDTKCQAIARDMPAKNDIARLEQQMQCVQQVLSLEHLDEKAMEMRNEMTQKASLLQLDEVVRNLYQDLGKKTADVMAQVEDGLTALRREMNHNHRFAVSEYVHQHHRIASPMNSVGQQRGQMLEQVARTVASQSAQETQVDMPFELDNTASFAQVDLSLQFLQQDLSRKDVQQI